MNKKAQMEILWVFVIFAAILVLGFVASILLGFTHWTTSILAPIASDLGEVNGYNVSDAGNIAFGTLNTIVGILPMLVGFGYLIMLIGCIALVLMYRGTSNPLFIGLFFALLILIVLIAILASNAYQDFYDADDEIALELQSQTMLSFLILQSPYIFAIVGFICGIFLFSGRQNESYGVQGGSY